MTMKHILYMTFLLPLFLVSCSDDTSETNPEGAGLITINPTIVGESNTRLDNDVIAGADGHNAFLEGDKVVLTKIVRTANPLNSFTYENVPFTRNGNNGWELDASYTKTLYWTDVNEHTIIGYSKATGTNFTLGTGTTYNGLLAADQSTADKMKTEDVLLSYSTAIKADPKTSGAAADLDFYHGLSKVSVEVALSGFASKNASTNTRTVLNSISVDSQPLDYTWAQDGYAVNATTGAGTGTNSNKEVTLWYALSSGTDNNKLFYAYGIVVPGTRDLTVSMKVQYPDAMDNSKDVVGTYQAKFTNVEFQPGKRTRLTVAFNHINCFLSTGCTLTEWNSVSSDNTNNPIRYNVFLKSVDMSTVKLATEATSLDDATWLYTNTESKVVDCYGNDGSTDKPYEIRDTKDILSLAKEVTNGRDFKGQFIKLTTDLYLQTSNLTNTLTWPGIGDDTHKFAGTFNGGGKTVYSVLGSPLFNTISAEGKISSLNMKALRCYVSSKLYETSISGSNVGNICNTNEGIIESCNVVGAISGTTSAGGICGTNSGYILGCCHQGKVTGSSGIAGGIVGTNTGTVSACYQGIGAVTATTVGGLVGNNTGTNVTNSYYDKTNASAPTQAIKGTDDTETVKGMAFADMEGNTFVATMNTAVNTWNTANTEKKITGTYQLVLSSLPLIK